MKKTTTALVIGTMALSLVACSSGPDDDFKEACKQAQGQVKKESEVRNMLSMENASYVSGQGGGGGRSGSSGKSKKKSKKSDNDWVCVKDGQILFEED